MKKYKYQRLSKEEKKKARNDFYKTEYGKNLKLRFKRINIYSIILILFGTYLLIEAIINKNSYAEYIYSTILIIFGIAFLISKFHIEMIKVNEFITKPKKATSKK